MRRAIDCDRVSTGSANVVLRQIESSMLGVVAVCHRSQAVSLLRVILLNKIEHVGLLLLQQRNFELGVVRISAKKAKQLLTLTFLCLRAACPSISIFNALSLAAAGMGTVNSGAFFCLRSCHDTMRQDDKLGKRYQ
eukprot:3325090-Amphidinium_carterae.2